MRVGVFVNAFRGQRIIDIGHRNDAATERDIRSL
jgi:hypothetical protein